MSKDYRINEQIRHREVRLIGDTGSQHGVVSIQEALRLAREAGLDLVEVASNATPAVCRIIDYGKFRYEQEKMAKEAKKRQVIIDVKEVRLRPRIEEHDYQVKLKNVCRFLEHGDKVKISVFFRGRELGFIDKGRQLLDRLAKDSEEFGMVEKLPKQEGKILIMIMVAYGKGKKPNAKD